MKTMEMVCDKASGIVERITKLILIPLSLGFTLLVFLAVLTRFVFQVPIVSSLEYSRICFVWFCFLGGSLAYKTKAHVRFVFMISKFPKLYAEWIQLAANLLCLTFFSVMFYQSVLLNIKVTITKFPASGLPYAVMYLSLPVAMLFCAVHSTLFITRNIQTIQTIRRAM